MARIDVAAEAAPVVLHDGLHRLLAHRQDVQPEQHGPQAVLLAHMVRAGAGAFFAAQRAHAGIEQVAEELPAGRGLVAGNAQRLRDAIDRAAGRHRARDALQPRRITRDQLGIGRQHRQAVAGRDDEVAAEDHVAVAVTVGRGAEVGCVGGMHQADQFLGIGRVRIGVAAAEVGQRRAVEHRAGGRAELPFQDGPRIGAGDGMHRVEAHPEARLRQQRRDAFEVEKPLHQPRITCHRVDDLDLHRAERAGAQALQVHVGGVEGQIAGDAQRALVDRRGELFRRRPAVADVVLDAEVTIGPAWVVAGRQHDAAEGPVLAHQIAERGRGQDAAAADQHAADAVGGGHAQDDLDRAVVEVAAVAAKHQRLPGQAGQCVEDRLHEVFQVAGALEHRDLLAQPRGAGQLAFDRLRGLVQDLHARSIRPGRRKTNALQGSALV